MKRIIGTLAGAVLAFTVVLLSTASPSVAAPYTLGFSGTVTDSSGVFPVLGSANGDPVSGSITFDSFNTTVFGPILAGNSFAQSGTSFTFHTDHPSVINFSYSRTDTGTGAVASSHFMVPAIELRGDGDISTLILSFGTKASPYTPLTSLAGFPTTVGGIIASLPGVFGGASGVYSVPGYGFIVFDITVMTAAATTPIPATLPLFGAALAMLGYVARRRKTARLA